VSLNQPVSAGGEQTSGRSVMKVPAFHSKLPGTSKHHDESTCTEGDNIESYNRASGTGGLPKCDHCKRISG
jgi:hypothetical protein